MDRDGVGMTSRRTRERMVQRVREMGIDDDRVLDALRAVPRHLFVEEALASRAYENTPLPIGFGQTISQPYIVALMTQEIFQGRRPARVLEVGTGCGYQAAVLAQLVDEVCTVERIEPLFRSARRRLRQLGYRNIRFKLANGAWGWEDRGPFDAIVVAAAPERVPEALLAQLAPGGRMLIPIGGRDDQALMRYVREADGIRCSRLDRVSFVPLVDGNT